jgi:hypothetical protein
MAELGIQPYAAVGLVERFNAHMAKVVADQQTAVAAEQTRAVDTDIAAVRNEWGTAYDNNRAVAESAIVKLVVPFTTADKAPGVVAALRASMGQGAMMRMFHAMGKGLATGQPHGIGAGGAPAGAQSLADKLYPPQT